MPNPYFDIFITQRSKGKSAGTGAAYQSGEKLFSSMARNLRIADKSKASFTRGSCFWQMTHPNMQTVKRSGTPPRKLRNNGTHSLPEDLF